MTTVQMIERLKEETKNNPVASAMFHYFAVRQRTRDIIRLSVLINRMKKEGFDYKPSEYAKVLKLLADLGLGTLMLGRNKQIKGLNNIKITLQSIGTAACGKEATLVDSKKRNKFSDLTIPSKKESATPGLTTDKITLVLMVKGKAIGLSFPADINANEMASIINRICKRESA